MIPAIGLRSVHAMARIVPSQVPEYIDRTFPPTPSAPNTRFSAQSGHAHLLAGLLDLVNAVPSYLIQLDGPDAADFLVSLAGIRSQMESWKINPMPSLVGIQGTRGTASPLAVILECLQKCPDEPPSPETQELSFVSDAALRRDLRLDISTIQSSLRNREWKPATVLAGSVVEALAELPQSEVSGVATALKLPRRSIEEWNLSHYIDATENLKIVTTNTATQARLAKDFRNLIHPGRVQRTEETCNFGTALSAAAAVEHVVEDMKKAVAVGRISHDRRRVFEGVNELSPPPPAP
jgi:hypothetical protein